MVRMIMATIICAKAKAVRRHERQLFYIVGMYVIHIILILFMLIATVSSTMGGGLALAR
jgi:hypothetical protein